MRLEGSLRSGKTSLATETLRVFKRSSKGKKLVIQVNPWANFRGKTASKKMSIEATFAMRRPPAFRKSGLHQTF
jgi:hypothetical protein